MKRSYLCCLISSAILLSTSLAQAVVEKTNGTKIYTDGFEIKSNAKQNVTVPMAVDAGVLGNVGNLTIVEGQKPEGVIAYVDTAKAKDYLIYDTLVVKCKTGVECIPASLNPLKLGSTDIYHVKVQDYDSWENTIEDLKNTNGVLKVVPMYEFGISSVAY